MFADPTRVTLTPKAAAGSKFTGWSGDCTGTGACAVEITGDRQVTATFGPASGFTGDFDGDGRADYVVYRNGDWYARGILSVTWGLPGDIPVPADYDGDHRADATIFRPSTGYWWVRNVGSVLWGEDSDLP